MSHPTQQTAPVPEPQSTPVQHQSIGIEESKFLENNPKWICCCGCHIKQAAMYICKFSIVMLCLFVVAVVMLVAAAIVVEVQVTRSQNDFNHHNNSSTDQPDETFNAEPYVLIVIVFFIWSVLEAVVLYFLYKGILLEKKSWLRPYIVFGVIEFVVQAVGLSPGAILKAWFVYVVFRCYKYFAEKEKADQCITYYTQSPTTLNSDADAHTTHESTIVHDTNEADKQFY